MFCSLLINGEVIEFGFFKYCFAYYLVCIIAYFAINIYVNDHIAIYRLIFLLSLLMLLNNITTILQFYDNSIGWGIGRLFGNIDEFEMYSGRSDTLLNHSKVTGILGSPVKNAFYITVISPLFLIKFNKKINIVYYLFVYTTSLFACFCTQQRAGFFLTILIFILWFILKFKNKSILLIPIISYLFINYFNNLEYGRLVDSDNSSRIYLLSKGINFIERNIFWGGPVKYLREVGLSTHNIVVDSWIQSGLFGFIIMMFLYLKTIYESIILSIKAIIRRNINLVIISLTLLITMIYGLTHNTSYLSGDVIIFIILAMTLKLKQLNNANSILF
jgi:hypothetical protein